MSQKEFQSSGSFMIFAMAINRSKCFETQSFMAFLSIVFGERYANCRKKTIFFGKFPLCQHTLIS